MFLGEFPERKTLSDIALGYVYFGVKHNIVGATDSVIERGFVAESSCGPKHRYHGGDSNPASHADDLFMQVWIVDASTGGWTNENRISDFGLIV